MGPPFKATFGEYEHREIASILILTPKCCGKRVEEKTTIPNDFPEHGLKITWWYHLQPKKYHPLLTRSWITELDDWNIYRTPHFFDGKKTMVSSRFSRKNNPLIGGSELTPEGRGGGEPLFGRGQFVRRKAIAGDGSRLCFVGIFGKRGATPPWPHS